MEHPPVKQQGTVCPSSCVAFATKILGDKWSPRLLFALSEKGLRFCELQLAAGGINPRTLTQRLGFLVTVGILSKQDACYSLTEKGRDLLPILFQMVSWGKKYQRPV